MFKMSYKFKYFLLRKTAKAKNYLINIGRRKYIKTFIYLQRKILKKIDKINNRRKSIYKK